MQAECVFSNKVSRDLLAHQKTKITIINQRKENVDEKDFDF